MGYWSARNAHNAKNHDVGKDTDGDGILGEVRRACNAEPSLTLMFAAANTYLKLSER
jgi:hypothetical protein